MSSAPSNDRDVFETVKADGLSQYSIDVIDEESRTPEPLMADPVVSRSSLADLRQVLFPIPAVETAEVDRISAELDVALDDFADGPSSSAQAEQGQFTVHEKVTKVSMRECLDESTLEPQFKITSIADLVRIRREEASELEKGKLHIQNTAKTHKNPFRKRKSPFTVRKCDAFDEYTCNIR